MGLYYVVIEYDNPKAVFETKKQAEKFIDDRPGRDIETVVSLDTAARLEGVREKNGDGSE